MTDIKEVLGSFSACVEDGAACADLLCRLKREGGSMPLRQIAAISRDAERLLSVEVLKSWPEDGFDAFVEFVSSMPYRPDPRDMPCGCRERFVAEVLLDMTVPKSRRIAFWRAFAMNGFRFPRYAKGSWNVPRALVDHMSVRGWIARTKGEGWRDIRNTDPTFFQSPESVKFGCDFEEDAWDAIAKDFPAGLMMPFELMGRELPRRYVDEVLRAGASNSLADLLENGNGDLKPRDVLFYVCANWNNDESIQILEKLEKSEPGVVASSVDTYGHNALWYTLYQRDQFGKATPAALSEMDPLDMRLIELGCNPEQECFLGLSWRDVAE